MATPQLQPLILEELKSRQGSFSPEQKIAFDELMSRYGFSKKFGDGTFFGEKSVSSPKKDNSFITNNDGVLGGYQSHAQRLLEGYKRTMPESVPLRPLTGQGGRLDTGALSGQLPTLLSVLGGIGGGVAGGIGSVPGTVIGGAGGKGLELALRQLSGLDKRPTVSGNVGSMVREGVKQGAYDVAGGIVAKPISKLAEVAISGIRSGKIPAFAKGLINGLPVIGSGIKASRGIDEQAAKEAFNLEEKARKLAFGRGVDELGENFAVQEAARRASYKAEKIAAQEAAKSIPQTTGAAARAIAGDNLSKAINIADVELQKGVSGVVAPIIKSNEKSVISVEPVRKQIVDILSENSLIDSKGNIIKSGFSKIISPSRRKMLETLSRISSILNKNPTVGSLNIVVKDLQSLANFDSLARGAEDKIFGSLSRTAKETLYDGLESVAGNDVASAIRSARKVFSENQAIFEPLRDIATKAPEKIVDSARTLFPGTFIVQAVGKQPALKAPISDIVLNNLARNFSSPKAFSAALDDFGRDALKTLFEPEVYAAVLNTEKQLSKSFEPFVPSRAPVPIPFKPGTPPYSGIGKFWEKQIANLKKGQVLSKPLITGLFKAIGSLSYNKE